MEKDNRGFLFPKQQKTDKHPNLTGRINVEGKEYSLSAWKQKSKKGADYLSLSVSELKEVKSADFTPPEKEDDLPF